jgi:hypothetical protein
MVRLFNIHENGRGGPEWTKATSRLSELLGAAPFQISGVDADHPEPPPGTTRSRMAAIMGMALCTGSS